MSASLNLANMQYAIPAAMYAGGGWMHRRHTANTQVAASAIVLTLITAATNLAPYLAVGIALGALGTFIRSRSLMRAGATISYLVAGIVAAGTYKLALLNNVTVLKKQPWQLLWFAAIIAGIVAYRAMLWVVMPPKDPNRQCDNATRAEVLRRDKHTCRYCGQVKGELHIDHIIPHSKGGRSTAPNLQVLCQRCNQMKSDRSDMDARREFTKQTGRKPVYAPIIPPKPPRRALRRNQPIS